MIAQNRLNSCHSLSQPFLMRMSPTFDSLTRAWKSCIFFLESQKSSVMKKLQQLKLIFRPKMKKILLWFLMVFWLHTVPHQFSQDIYTALLTFFFILPLFPPHYPLAWTWKICADMVKPGEGPGKGGWTALLDILSSLYSTCYLDWNWFVGFTLFSEESRLNRLRMGFVRIYVLTE